MSEFERLSRRTFLKTGGLVGAGALLPLGRSGTGVVLKQLIPEEDIIPGISYWLPSTCGECSAGCGIRVRTREGNAVKIEGNERHPVNRGGLCARGQAALQGLYSPARIRSPLGRNDSGRLDAIGWSNVETELAKLREAATAARGKIVVVTSQVTGGMRAMLDQCAAGNPQLSVIVHEPLDYASMAAANRLCFGIDAVPTYRIEHARTIVSFGADLLDTWLSPVSNANGFAASRRLDTGTMSRLVQFESYLSLTGANADERYACPPGPDALIALAVASLMLTEGTLPQDELKAWQSALKPFTVERAAGASGLSQQLIRDVANRLRAETPSLAVTGGPGSRTEFATAVQVAVNLINVIAGNYGRTITFERTEHPPVGTHRQLLEVVEDMEAGKVAALLVNETSLEFAFPEPERLRNAMKQVPLKLQLASVRDGSTDLFDLVLPVHHWLERWDRVEPRSGVHSLQQPIITPWCDSVHPGQLLLSALNDRSGGPGEETGNYESFVRKQWENIHADSSATKGFADFWREVLVEGGYWSGPIERKLRLDVLAAQAIRGISPAVLDRAMPELLPIMTVRYGSGRQTGFPWLHELPDPITTVAWDCPLLISPDTAAQWKCQSGEVVRLESDRGIVEAPVYVQAGTSDGVVAIALGSAGSEYAPYNFDPASHPLHRLTGAVDAESGALSWAGVTVKFLGVTGRRPLARLQGDNRQDTRDIARAISLGEIQGLVSGTSEETAIHEHDLYPKHEHPIHDWGMAIDLSACVGCGACTVACQAENNVPVVGREQCLLGRELSWLRIERFIDKGRIVFLPMLCQQCEHAPCETVCPVYASVHSSEGLNQQVYNRCVGTRYCANNCPYKVRRFNWYTYNVEPPLDRQYNPDVFVRTRGIMEKCTFCVQRIREYTHIAKDEKRALRDGEVTPACAQSCPTGAIVFGDLNDTSSRVSRLFGDPRGYTIFAKLNTQPSIVYLKRAFHDDGTIIRSL